MTGPEMSDWPLDALERLWQEAQAGPHWTWRDEVGYWVRVPYWAAVRAWHRTVGR